MPVKDQKNSLLNPQVLDWDYIQSNKSHSYHLCITLVHGRHANVLRMS